MKVLLDTTMLCAAVRTPHGLSMKLLKLGLAGLFEPIVTEEVVAEWTRVCRAGFGRGATRVTYAEADLDAFWAALQPMLSAETIARVRIGRAASPVHPVREEAGIRMIQLPAGGSGGASRMIDAATLGIKDIGDFHLVEAALRFGCDYLCTRNARDFADGLRIGGQVEVATPERLYQLLTE